MDDVPADGTVEAHPSAASCRSSASRESSASRQPSVSRRSSTSLHPSTSRHSSASCRRAASGRSAASDGPVLGDGPTLDLERDLASKGFDLIIGCDEVGRGALAGPVMVGAAALWARALDGATVPEGLRDSKLLTPHRREALVDPLRAWCAAVEVGSAGNAEIDDWGISHALGVAALRAMARVEDALGDTGPLRVGVILDGPFDYITAARDSFDAPDSRHPFTVTTMVKADMRCAVVSAASVVAKVTRDALMDDLSRSDPSYAPYRWESNKGYGSAAHREAIARLGPTSWHRTSWHLA